MLNYSKRESWGLFSKIGTSGCNNQLNNMCHYCRRQSGIHLDPAQICPHIFQKATLHICAKSFEHHFHLHVETQKVHPVKRKINNYYKFNVVKNRKQNTTQKVTIDKTRCRSFIHQTHFQNMFWEYLWFVNSIKIGECRRKIGDVLSCILSVFQILRKIIRYEQSAWVIGYLFFRFS